MADPPPPSRLRKQLDDLEPADLEVCPCWEFADDELRVPGQDARTMRPRPDWKVADPSLGRSVARATFEANDGTVYHGYYHVTADESAGARQPTILTASGPVTLWLRAMPGSGTLDAWLAWLGTTPERLFPLTWRGELPAVAHEPRGEITSFRRWSERDPNGRVVALGRPGWGLRR